MGKQVKGWVPPDDAVEMTVVKDDVQEDPKKVWTPPTDAVPVSVKKKDEFAPPTDGVASGTPSEKPTKSSGSNIQLDQKQLEALGKAQAKSQLSPEDRRQQSDFERTQLAKLKAFATGDKTDSRDAFSLTVDNANDFGARFNQAVVSGVTSLPKAIAIGANYLDELFGTAPAEKKVEEYATYKLGEGIDKKAREWGITITDPKNDDSFLLSSVPSAMGSVAAMAMFGTPTPTTAILKESTSLATKAATELVKGAVSPSGIIGGTSMAVPEFEAAKAAGMSDDEAFDVFLKNYAVGQTERIPISRAFSRINKLSGGKFIEVLKAGTQGGLEEGTQEFVQGFLTNKIAQGSYDPNRDSFTGLIDQAGAGFFVGFILPGIGAAMQNMTDEQRAATKKVINEKLKEEPLVIDQSVEDIAAAVPQGDIVAAGQAAEVIQEKVKQTSQFEVIPRSREGVLEGTNFEYWPNKRLTPDDSSLESKFGKELDENFEEKKIEYVNKYGNVLDTDNARNLSEDYRNDPEGTASAINSPASSFLFKVYTDMLSESPKEGQQNKVTFVVGGSGVGKSTYVNKNKINSQIVFDTTFSEPQISKNQINRALNAGKNVDVTYIYRDPVESFKAMVNRSSTDGRLVPIEEFSRGHIGGQSTIEKLKNDYKDEGRVKIKTIGSPKSIDGNLKEQLIQITEKMLSNGTITNRQYSQLTGKSNETPPNAQASTQSGGDVAGQSVPTEPAAAEATQPVGREEGQQQTPDVVDSASTQETESGGIPPVAEQADVKSEPAGDARTLKIAKRIMDSDANEAIKKGVKEKGATYIPKKIEVTDKEASDLIDLYGEEKADSVVRDTKNDVTADTRIALSAKLYDKYKKQGDAATDPAQKQAFYDKAVDVGLFTAEYAKELGRGVNAAKIMKAITSNEDLAVIALEKANKSTARKLVAPVQKQVAKTKESIDAEIRRLVEQKVQETVETRLARAKLITNEKKKKISDAFDALKIKDVKGTANDITRVVGSAIWNGSMEAVKRAVLTGADVANAIQAGIDYIRDHHKGDFSEDEFRNMVAPAIEPLIEKQKIKPTDIDESKVKTKGLSAKKRKDLITQVVEEYNQKGEISDERFEELYAKQIGYREYTTEERAQIRELAKVIGEAEKFSQDLQEKFSRDKIAQYTDLMKKAQKANQDLQAFAREPSSLTDTLISIMQGNLLTPLSIVTNIYSNAALQPLRFTASAVGSVVERLVNMAAKIGLISKAYKDPTIDLIEVQKGFVQGAWTGTMEGLYQLKEGTLAQDKNLREIQSSFNPARAIARWSEADRNTKQKINDWVEGTLGWPAEGMFRLLNFGDKPFRRAAELGRAMEIIDRKKLKGDEALKFLMFPDEQSAAEIDKAGKEATFQQDGNVVTKWVQENIIKFLNLVQTIPYVGGVAKFLLKTQIPFVKTPLNIVGETLDYALPPLTIARGIMEVMDGNARAGYVRIGKGLTGLMIMAAARQLFELGILSWEDDDDKKGRNIQYESVPPASLNASALTRGLLGEGFDTRDGDAWVNYKKMGIVGILFDTYTRSYKSGVEEDGQMPGFAQEMAMSPITVSSSVLEQSFLQGTNSLLNALQDGGGYKTQQWAVNTVGTMTSVVIPNTLATVSKSSDEFIRETYDRDIVSRLRATYMTKLFAGEQLPPKINIWGEKVTGNPEGRDKYVYYLFDPTKFKEVDTEGYKYKLYEAWKDDKFNNDWLPSLPKRTVSVKGVNVKLTPEEYSEFSAAVGEYRANATSAYVNSSWRYHKNEAKLKKLKDIYEDGMKFGKKKFLMNKGWNVQTKEALEEMNKSR